MDHGSLMRPPSQSYKVSESSPGIKSKLNPHKITVSMRNPDTLSIIEIPLDGELDEI
jgi:hypothetical protein